MDGSYKVFKTNSEIIIHDPGIFYGIGKEDDAFPSVPLLASFQTENKRSLLAYWLPWNAQEYLPELAEVSIQVKNIQFKDPVLVNCLDGSVYKIMDFKNQKGSVKFDNLPLADYPFIIIEKNEIKLL